MFQSDSAVVHKLNPKIYQVWRGRSEYTQHCTNVLGTLLIMYVCKYVYTYIHTHTFCRIIFGKKWEMVVNKWRLKYDEELPYPAEIVQHKTIIIR